MTNTTGNLSYFEMYRNRDVSVIDNVHKFGRNTAVGNTFEPIVMGGVYQMPQVAAATKLRVKAGNTNDTAAGSGARSITIQGLDETGAYVTEVLPTAGVSAGAPSTNTYLRLFRLYIEECGTYANSTADSMAATIAVENNAGTADWGIIDKVSSDYGRGQSEIGAYTIPLGYTAYIVDFKMTSVTSNSIVRGMICQRQGILDAAAPYPAMRKFFSTGMQREETMTTTNPYIGPFSELTDVVVFAKATASPTEVETHFTVVLVQN